MLARESKVRRRWGIDTMLEMWKRKYPTFDYSGHFMEEVVNEMEEIGWCCSCPSIYRNRWKVVLCQNFTTPFDGGISREKKRKSYGFLPSHPFGWSVLVGIGEKKNTKMKFCRLALPLSHHRFGWKRVLPFSSRHPKELLDLTRDWFQADFKVVFYSKEVEITTNTLTQLSKPVEKYGK